MVLDSVRLWDDLYPNEQRRLHYLLKGEPEL
jgi:hypothetical protein